MNWTRLIMYQDSCVSGCFVQLVCVYYQNKPLIPLSPQLGCNVYTPSCPATSNHVYGIYVYKSSFWAFQSDFKWHYKPKCFACVVWEGTSK